MSRARRSPYHQLLQDHVQRTFELPVDLVVDNDGDAMRLLQEVLKLQRKLTLPGPAGRTFLAYANARSRLAALREEGYFDQGFLRGRLAGLAEVRLRRREGRDLARKVTEIALASGLDHAAAAVAVLETACALVGAACCRTTKARRRCSTPPKARIDR